MELQALRARVQPALHQDFDAVREEFVAETGTDDPRAFVHHLREWELIPFDLANTLLIELAVERGPEDGDDDEDEPEAIEEENPDDEEPQDPTMIMRWDDESNVDVDPDALTKHHDRSEILGWVDDPSDADDIGTLIVDGDGDDPHPSEDDDEIDPEADTVHLDRRFTQLEDDGTQAVLMRRTPAGVPTRTPPPHVRDPAYVNTLPPGRAAQDARVSIPPVSNRPVSTPPGAPRETPAPAPTKASPTPGIRVRTSPPPAEREQSPPASSEASLAEVPTLVEAAPAPPVEAPSEPPAPALELPVDPAGRYEFQEVIDEDGLARTVLVLDTEVGRHVALRVMNDELVVHAPLIQRFKTETRASSQLDHPGIPAIHDLRGGSAYFHRLMEGEPLATWLAEARAAFEARKPLPIHLQPEALLERFVQVCDILAYAHGRGIIHRDVRPDNVLVGPYGATWVVDWGIALLVDENVPNPVQLDPTPEDRRVLVGTAGYCSPEQANGRQQGLDIRSDVYALGLLLFEILALKPAVGGTSVSGRLARQQQGQTDPLVHAYGRWISPTLRAIVTRATTKDPRERYPTASALAEDVRRAIRGQPISARGEGVLAATGRVFSRHPAVVWTVLAMLILGWTMTLFLAIIVYST